MKRTYIRPKETYFMFDDFHAFTKEDFAITGKIGQVFDQAMVANRKILLEKNQKEGGLKKSTIMKAIMDALFQAIDWNSYCKKYISYSEADDWEIQSVLFPFCELMIEYIMKPQPGDPPVPHQPGKLTCMMNEKIRLKREQGFLQDGVMYLFSNVHKIQESSIPKRLLQNQYFKVSKEIQQLHKETDNAFIAKLNLIHRSFHASVYSQQDIIVNNKYSIGSLITAFTAYEAFSIPQDAIVYKNGTYSVSHVDVAPGAYVSYRYLFIHSETKKHIDKIVAFLEKKPYLHFPISQVEESAQKYFMDRDVSGFSLLNLFLQDNAAFTSDKNGHVTIYLGEDIYGKFPQTEFFAAFLQAMNEWNHMGYDTENIEFVIYERGNGPAVNPEKREILVEQQQKIAQKKRNKRQ